MSDGSRYRRPILEQRILIYITLAYSGLGLRGLTLAHAGHITLAYSGIGLRGLTLAHAGLSWANHSPIRAYVGQP